MMAFGVLPAPKTYEVAWKDLNTLSEKDREVILLIALDDLSNSEAARVLGCTRRTFAVRAFRARSRLKKHLGDIRTQLLSESLGPKAEKS